MKNFLITLISAALAIAAGFGIYNLYDRYTSSKPMLPLGTGSTPTPKQKPLEKYSIENLGKRIFEPSQVVFDEAVATTSAYTKYTFHFTVDGKKATGLATIPNSINKDVPTGTSPVIIQFRGYVDHEIYSPGIGTSRSAEVFASHGYISLAPDFLGYGGSDMPSTDVFEERFQTYTVAVQLYNSLKTIPFADPEKVAFWGHSNGGHIALTSLEILNKPIPTTLWAPVTKPFPYSILYFTDEAEDEGKSLRKELAKFEQDYDVFDYALTHHIDRLVGPIQLHQGDSDEAVPIAWSNTFVKLLKDAHKDITYFTYPGADHNLQPSWNTVVERDVEFFRTHF